MKGNEKIASYEPTLAIVLPLEIERTDSKKKPKLVLFKKIKIKIKIYTIKMRRWIFKKKY